MESSSRTEAKVLVLAHCILNQAARWWQSGNPRRIYGPVREVLDVLSSLKIGVLQLPCPEFSFCGNPRPPRTKDEYENLEGFRLHCVNLARRSALELKNFLNLGRDPKIRLLAIVGVEYSPTCGVNWTTRRIDGKSEYVNEKGLFIEALEKELEDLGLNIPFLGIDLHNPADFHEKLNRILSLRLS